MVTGTSGRWDEFVRRAKEYLGSERPEDSERLISEELNYKVEIGRELAEAREAVLGGADGWGDLVTSGIKGNLVHFTAILRLRTWLNERPDDALRALQAIWTRDDLSVAERVRAFSDLFPASETSREGQLIGLSGAGSRMSFISALLMGLNVHEYPPFRVTVFDKVYERTGYGGPERGADEATLYGHALGFLDLFIKEALKRGLPLRDRLDAQSVVWGIQDEISPPSPPLTWIRDPVLLTRTRPPPPPPPDPWTPHNVETLAGELRWEPSQLQKIVDGLKDKRQAIFQGPPQDGRPRSDASLSGTSRKPSGMHPVNWFPPRRSHPRLARPPNSGGISPRNSLLSRYRNSRLARLPNFGGISPFNWFSERISPSRLARLPNSGGICPLNSLSPRYRSARLARLPNSGGICPLNWFYERYSPSRLARPPNSGGICPLNWFPERYSHPRLARLPNSGGICPLNWFSARYSHPTWVRLPNSGGICPLNSLSPRYRSVRLARLPNSGGICPLNWLLWTYNTSRLARLPNADGTCPLNWFLSRIRWIRLVRLPNSGGISPRNWLLERSRSARLARLPNSGGICPLNWFPARSNLVTRPMASVVTPRQSPIGAALSQLPLFNQFAPPVAL